MAKAIIGKNSITCVRGQGKEIPLIVLKDKQGNELLCTWEREKFDREKDDRAIPVKTRDGVEKKYLKSFLSYDRDYDPQKKVKNAQRNKGKDSTKNPRSEGQDTRVQDASGGEVRDGVREVGTGTDVLEESPDTDGEEVE